jgi:hypothetical protein
MHIPTSVTLAANPTLMMTIYGISSGIGAYFSLSSWIAGDLNFEVYNGTGGTLNAFSMSTSGGVISANKWQHVAFTFTAIYKNSYHLRQRHFAEFNQSL